MNLISFEDSSESSRLMGGGGNFESIEKYKIFYILFRKDHEVTYFLIFLPIPYREELSTSNRELLVNSQLH